MPEDDMMGWKKKDEKWVYEEDVMPGVPDVPDGIKIFKNLQEAQAVKNAMKMAPWPKPTVFKIAKPNEGLDAMNGKADQMMAGEGFAPNPAWAAVELDNVVWHVAKAPKPQKLHFDVFLDPKDKPAPGTWDINHVYHWDDWGIVSPFEIPLGSDVVCRNGKAPWDHGSNVLTKWCSQNHTSPSTMWPQDFINFPYFNAVYRPPPGFFPDDMCMKMKPRSNPIFRMPPPIP